MRARTWIIATSLASGATAAIGALATLRLGQAWPAVAAAAIALPLALPATAAALIGQLMRLEEASLGEDERALRAAHRRGEMD